MRDVIQIFFCLGFAWFGWWIFFHPISALDLLGTELFFRDPHRVSWQRAMKSFSAIVLWVSLSAAVSVPSRQLLGPEAYATAGIASTALFSTVLVWWLLRWRRPPLGRE